MDGKAENGTESGDGIEGAVSSPSRAAATVEDIKPTEELPNDEPQQGFESVAFGGGEMDEPRPRRIHILGFSAHARFIAHAIASTPGVPVSIIAHHPKVMTRWGEEKRMLSLYDSAGRHTSSVEIPCPEALLASPQSRRSVADPDYFLDHVIVDVMSAAILPSLAALRHRIDSQTTICLLQPGLGLMERLNEAVFTDPVTRPNFVLGHSTHLVSKFSSLLYSMKYKRSGGLYLHAVSRSAEDPPPDQSSIDEGKQQSQHLARLLSSAETLNVTGLSWDRFLARKLPWLIFCSAADAICVSLGCRYKAIYHNPHARNLWENLLDETAVIVSQLPELTPEKRLYFAGNGFRRQLRTFLVAMGPSISPWISRVRWGEVPPVDYFNGYIVRRAQELGLDHTHNAVALETVKARMLARSWELRNDVLGSRPYMMDKDLVDGGQHTPNQDDILELELDGL
ncbi:hypothetical protein F4803DRAFT_177318 [Xylaria telfairii]|nr:hypothetical protein F4803DRAFT_177318 [Xylaria telfairii]